jgi:hypothetical protein
LNLRLFRVLAVSKEDMKSRKSRARPGSCLLIACPFGDGSRERAGERDLRY